MNFTWLRFVIMGFLGGLCYVLIKSRSWEEIAKFKMARRLIIGAVVGYIYSQMYSSWGFPDFVMSFIAGYFGVDFIESIVTRFKKPEKKRGSR